MIDCLARIQIKDGFLGVSSFFGSARAMWVGVRYLEHLCAVEEGTGWKECEKQSCLHEVTVDA